MKRFEIKSEKFLKEFQRGISMTVWYLAKGEMLPEGGEELAKDKFVVSNTPVLLKLVKSDDGGLTTSNLVFSKSVSHRKTSIFGALTGSSGGGKIDSLLPVALHEILDIRAGCARSMSENSEEVLDVNLDEIWSKAQLSNNECGHFMTIIATATPATPARYFYLKFKSRTERNDSLCGFRSLIADIQIFEGTEGGGDRSDGWEDSAGDGKASPFRGMLSKINARNVTPAKSTRAALKSSLSSSSSSSLSTPSKSRGSNIPTAENLNLSTPSNLKTTTVFGAGGQKEAKKMVLLEDVKRQLGKERSKYERIMVQLLQFMSDLNTKENEIETLTKRLELEEKKYEGKRKGQKENNKMIYQLSKKLEMLLLDNSELRDQIECLKEQRDLERERIVAREAEKTSTE